MKICYLCADRGISLSKHVGSSTHFRSLVRAFSACGHEVSVIMASTDGAEDLGVPVLPIPVPEIYGSLSAEVQRREKGKSKGIVKDQMRVVSAVGHVWHNLAVEKVLSDALSQNRPDVIYERSSPFGVAGAIVAHRVGIPHLLEVNAPLAWEGARYRQQALQEAAHVLEQAAFTVTSQIVAVSRELRDELVTAGTRASKIKVVPNGVDVDLFRPEGQTRRDGLEGKVVIGFVGSLKPWHGVDILVEALRQLAADARFHLLVVGEGPMAKVLRALEEELPGRVTVTGGVPQREVPAYIRAMDIAVAPYPALERFYFSPLKVLEYMATGRAVVASRIGQLDELIRDGETGLLVPPGDPGALAEAIRSLAADQNLRRVLGTRAAAEARRAHTWTQRVSDITELAEAMP